VIIFLLANYCHAHWLDYVTESEVDITALTHWLDYVAEPEVDITALTHWLDYVAEPEVDITALTTLLRQTNICFCQACSVSPSCIKAIT